MNTLSAYTIDISATVLDALKKIDSNKKGFVIVENKEGFVEGVLTDGDIRRAFIKGYSANDGVRSVCKKEYRFLRIAESIALAAELFKSESIKFLPVLTLDGRLANIITKGQMHALLLQDVRADLTYDFSTLDERVVDTEISPRPWGFYKTTVLNDYFQSKIITVWPGQQLSLQSHNRREEHWIVVHGCGVVQIEQSFKDVKCGDCLFIPKGTKHRLTNTSDTDTLIVTEVQIGDYLGEDDIIRHEDVYGRA